MLDRRLACVFVAASLVVPHETAFAQDLGTPAPDSESIARDRQAMAYKLTTALYHTTHQPYAYDINLRGNIDMHTAWMGFYKRGNEFQQARLGYSDTITV